MINIQCICFKLKHGQKCQPKNIATLFRRSLWAFLETKNLMMYFQYPDSKKHNKLLHDIFSVSNLYSCKHSKFQLALIWNKLKGCCFLKEDIKVICDCFIMSEGVGSATMKCSAASCMIPFSPQGPVQRPRCFLLCTIFGRMPGFEPEVCYAITNELHTSLFKKIFLNSHTED